MYNKSFIRMKPTNIGRYMKVIGLLSSEEEANEIRYIAQVCEIEGRIRFLIHIQKIKDMLKKS